MQGTASEQNTLVFGNNEFLQAFEIGDGFFLQQDALIGQRSDELADPCHV